MTLTGRTGPDARRSWPVPAVATLVWALVVLAGGHAGRVLDHWVSSAATVVGAFTAGVLPQGGGAVAFPAVTKVLDVPVAPARTLALLLQAVGLSVASVVVLRRRLPVAWRAVVPVVLGGLLGLGVALTTLTDSASAFREPTIPAPHLRVAFTIAVAATALVLARAPWGDAPRAGTAMPTRPRRRVAGIAVLGLAGGVTTGLTGTGVEVAALLAVVHLGRRHPRVGLHSAVLAMAIVSSIGGLTLALGHGQFAIDLDAVGQVVAVGGADLPPLDAARYDLFGLWLAAVPAAIWAFPLGTALADRLPGRVVVPAVLAVAAVEVASTVATLAALREDPTVRTVAAVGFAATCAAVLASSRRSARPEVGTSDADGGAG